MEIERISVQNLRTHTRFSCGVTDRVSVIIGKNGSGKTTLLEALYIALRGASFKGSDKELISYGQDWWRIDVETSEGLRTISLDSRTTPAKKKFIISEKQTARLPQNKKYPVILFEPSDLRLIEGSPSRRRDFFDQFIDQIYFDHTKLVAKYNRILKQRNAALKNEFLTPDDVFVWDVSLAKYGSEIVNRRIRMIERINQDLNRNYYSIAGVEDQVSVHYSDTMIDSVEQKILDQLRHNFNRDKILGYTSIGPHRHDIIFNFNQQPANKTASRGEVRSIILALKFLEVDLTTEATDIAPIILLDDVFAELDETRQKRLAEKIKYNQMFLTSTAAYSDIDTRSVINLDQAQTD